MKKYFLILIIAIFLATACFIFKEPVNMCGQTMAKANNPINWHNGVYSPDGCNINK